MARTGLRALNGKAEPTHLATYASAATEYRLAPGAQELRVPITWTDEQGVTVTKTYVFKPGRYDVRGASTTSTTVRPSAWSGASYVQLARHIYTPERSMFDVESYAYRGPAIYDGKSYQQARRHRRGRGQVRAERHGRLDRDDAAPFRERGRAAEGRGLPLHARAGRRPRAAHLPRPAQGGPGRHHRPFQPRRCSSARSCRRSSRTVGPRLELTADYGKLTILSQPLFWLLEKVYGFVGNWGWAIIIVTFLLKLLFYKLTETSGRSMAKMRTIAPRIKSIQERYKDDREQLAKQMMEIYKREKINPVAGCLPILVQIPVFLAFYWVLLESVEMRQAPFMLWIQDLSSKDPFFILPILMGVAMFGQFKLNPAPPDPMQAKMFAFMPVIMTVMMAWFPSGLVLYWLTNTLLSIAQQWKINKVVEAEAKKGG